MNANLDPPSEPSEPDASALYDRHFTVVPADTPELLDAVHALRYQVYCVERQFEDPAQQSGGRERDRYDPQSVHAALIAKSSGQVVGCVRLILPRAWRRGAGPADSRTLEPGGSAGSTPSAEIGPRRFPVIRSRSRIVAARVRISTPTSLGRAVRKRASPPGASYESWADARRLPRGGAARHRKRLRGDGAAAPAPARTIRPRLRAARATIEYHGLRQPCVADGQQLLAGMARASPRVPYQLIAQTYHGTPTPQHAIP